ncbi:T9SS type A sorting domain-containing protein [Lewinella cohaerens]|uniref:T9SS type A sorting domain-containing protein n=1 Tax=Lewinella cohaerens TaxID=70995 RepID=UPI00037B2C80|nr:T9SS type A sorting domain-containing protein [Lewinella cohaerens]
MKYFFAILITLLFQQTIVAQNNFNEDFDLNLGTLNNQNQWSGNASFQVITDAMTLADYPQNNADGQVLQLQSSGGNIGRDNLLATSFASGAAYLSFLVRIDNESQLPTFPDYQMAVEKEAFASTFAGFGFYKDQLSGVIKAALTTQSIADEVTSTATFAAATVYHVVLKYEFIVAGNDLLKVYISPDFMPQEPVSPTLTTTVNGTGLPDQIGRILINAPAASINMMVVDGIQLGNVWNGFFDLGLLPVELSEFRGEVTDSGTQLYWQTRTEHNNQSFMVERSIDGKNFNTIGEVAGNGDSQQTINYKYTDPNPNFGMNYYRLTQVDFSGECSQSEIIALNSTTKFARINLYPNPTSSFLTVNFPNIDVNNISIRRSDGTIMPLNYQEQSTSRLLIDIRSYEPGWYVIEIYSNGVGYDQELFVVQ